MKIRLAALLGMAFAASVLPVAAHHSFAAEFDVNKPVTLTGSVIKVEWTNPHAHFYITDKDDQGGTANWEFEMGSPNALIRHGWNRNSLKPGDVVTVAGYLAKDGSKIANARSVTLADGRKVFAGSSLEGEPAQ